MVETDRCWACGRLAIRTLAGVFSRIEDHHVFEGKEFKIPLCILCHDIVDRLRLDDTNVFVEFLKVVDELNDMPREKYIMTKLLILKIFKIIPEMYKLGNANEEAQKNI